MHSGFYKNVSNLQSRIYAPDSLNEKELQWIFTGDIGERYSGI